MCSHHHYSDHQGDFLTFLNKNQQAIYLWLLAKNLQGQNVYMQEYSFEEL